MKFFILGLIVCCFVIQSTNGFSSEVLIALLAVTSPNFCPCIDDLICIPLNGSLSFDFCVNVKNASNCNGLIAGFTECEICTNNNLIFCPGNAGFTDPAFPFSGGTCTSSALRACPWLPSQNDTITSPTECPASVCETLDCPTNGERNKTTICHKPDTKTERTIEVDTSEVPAHLGHGDFLGSCEVAQSARAFNSYVRSGVSSAPLLLFNFIYMMCAVAMTAAV